MDKLNELTGVGNTTIEKLKASGFYTFMSLATASPGNLADLVGLSEAKCRVIIQESREKVELGFKTGKQVEIKRESIARIPLHFKEFDDMIGGGFECGTLVEIHGGFGTGKTQLCHLLSASCQKSYPNAKVLYVDSENCFRPDRVRDFCKTLKLDADTVLENIHHAIATNTDHQMLLVSEIEKMIGTGMDVKLIIIDSLTSHFRSEFQGRGTLAPRQQKLNAHMHDLMRLAMVYDLVVFVTNQVQSDPGSFFGNPEKAIGGNIVAHNASTRIYVRRGQKGSRVAKLIDSPNLPDGECSYFVTKDGLKEVK
jgi:DNA repair protein RadA